MEVIVMKKSIALICALVLLAGCLTACGNSENGGSNAGADSIIGTWEYVDGGFTYEFKADGTGVYGFGNLGGMNFTYATQDGILSIQYEGNAEPTDLEYILDGDTLNIKDSFGSDTIYKRK